MSAAPSLQSTYLLAAFLALIVTVAEPSAGESTLLRGRVLSELPFQGEVSEIVWSPSGEWGAYTISETRDKPLIETFGGPEIVSLCVISADQKTVKRLYTGHPWGGFAEDAFCGEHTLPMVKCWSPDSRRVLFYKFYPLGTVGARGAPLYDADPVSGKIRLVTRPYKRDHMEGAQIDDVVPFANCVTFSPDCSRLAVVFGDGRYGDKELRIGVLDNRTLARTWITGLNTGATSPDWSPDGKWISYAALPTEWTDEMKKMIGADSRYAAAYLSIWVMRPDGSGKRQLTKGPGSGDNPRWVDEQTIRYIVGASNADCEEWEIKLHSGQRKFVRTLALEEANTRMYNRSS